MSDIANYSDDQARARLRDGLGSWTVEDGHLRREFSCHGWRASMLLANGIAHLAEVTWHHPDLQVSWGRVAVALRTHSADAITDKDFELAEMIERFAAWSPGPSSALEGAPNDGEWRYLDRG
jgi:pterin-4a-carbinolamine dehydratase